MQIIWINKICIAERDPSPSSNWFISWPASNNEKFIRDSEKLLKAIKRASPSAGCKQIFSSDTRSIVFVGVDSVLFSVICNCECSSHLDMRSVTKLRYLLINIHFFPQFWRESWNANKIPAIFAAVRLFIKESEGFN